MKKLKKEDLVVGMKVVCLDNLGYYLSTGKLVITPGLYTVVEIEKMEGLGQRIFIIDNLGVKMMVNFYFDHEKRGRGVPLIVGDKIHTLETIYEYEWKDTFTKDKIYEVAYVRIKGYYYLYVNDDIGNKNTFDVKHFESLSNQRKRKLRKIMVV